MSNRFGTLFGTLRASVGEAIRYVLRLQSRSTLAKRMNEFLLRGFTVPDELSIEALDKFLANSVCRTRGCVRSILYPPETSK